MAIGSQPRLEHGCLHPARDLFETRAYRDSRAREQLSPKDILRCLKRYLAREVYTALNRQDVADPELPAAA